MQTSYQVVKNAVHFKSPDRIPVQCSWYGISDTYGVDWGKPNTVIDDYNYTDFWGCGWRKVRKDNMGQIVKHPLADWDNLGEYQFPDPKQSEFYSMIESSLVGSENKYVVITIFLLIIDRLFGLRGFENTLTDLYLDRQKIENLADRIVDFHISTMNTIASMFPGRIHAMNFADDWGTERQAYVPVELWDEFFKPKYKKIFDSCKQNGWDIWMHSCGRINKIIPSLIDIGLDVINMSQPITNGIDEIGSQFAGKLCFQACCDIQKTLPFGSDQEIEQEAKDLILKWGTDKGGIIFSDYGDGDAIGVAEEKRKVMFDAFIKYDRWKNN
jgi:uroporphyrinogen decarboxylase